MNPAGSFTPPAGFNQDVGLGWDYLRVTNCSPYQLSISLGGQGTKRQPEMFLEDIGLTQAFNGKVVITSMMRMSAISVTNALTNYVELEVYGRGEIRAPVAQPITTLANVGSPINLTNLTAPLSLQTTESGSNVDLLIFNVTDKKKYRFFEDTNGTLQLVDDTDLYTVMTWNPVSQTMDNNNITTDGAGGLSVKSLKGATGSKLKAISQFSGTGTTASAAHGLGTTPTAVLINGSNSLATFAWSAAGATTVTITELDMGSNPWVAIAMAF